MNRLCSISASLAIGCISLSAAAGNPESLLWSTFLGGSLGDINQDVIADSSGNIYACGTTQSADFPVTPGAFDTSFNGGTLNEYGGDVWVAKLNGETGELIWATFIGGPEDEEPDGILVNAAGEVVVLGCTASASFPVTPGASDTTHNGDFDCFLFKLSANGDSLLFSTFLGGSGRDDCWERDRLGLDPAGNIYVTGCTYSGDFPTTPSAFDTSHNGGGDAFVTKFTPDGSTVLYSTYLGGSNYELGMSLAVSSAGEAYVTGFTHSSDFPATPEAFDATLDGGRDVFVTKLNADGSDLVYSTLIGGDGYDRAWDLTLDISGDLYVAGDSKSSDYPVTAGAYQVTTTGSALFVTRVNADGTGLTASTLFPAGIVLGMERDADGSVWVAGETSTTNLPTTPLAFSSSYNGGEADGYVAQFSSSLGDLLYCSYVGGTSDEPDAHIAADSMGHILLGGRTMSANFPVTPDAPDTTFGGDGVTTGESYVLKLDPRTIKVHYLTLFESEMAPLYTSMGEDYLTADLDADGLPDYFQVGLVAYVLSVQTHPYSVLVEGLYTSSIATLRTEANYATELQPYEHILAALLVTSQDMIDFLAAQFSLTGSYSAFVITKEPDEPFSAQGDLDGDGTSNVDEYANVIESGGSLDDFMEAANDASTQGLLLPVTSVSGVLVLMCALGLSAWAHLRLKRAH